MRSGSESVQEDFDRMSLIDHLEELRHRVVWSVVAVGVAFIAAWTFIKPIAAFLARPVYKVLPGQKLAFLLMFKRILLRAIRTVEGTGSLGERQFHAAQNNHPCSSK